jgi:putative photosynthetic complex assembly protein
VAASRGQSASALPIGFALLIGTAIVVAAWSSRNRDTTPEITAPLYSYELRFEDDARGRVSVYLGTGDELIDVMEPGGSSFVRGVLRAMARERRQHGISTLAPFRISQLPADRLVIEDPTTGRRIPLEPFGPDNVAAFRALLDAAQAASASGLAAGSLTE